jgi:signal transduction histidine kinase
LYAVFIVLKSSALGRIVLAGLAAGLAVAALGWTLERLRFGASDAEAIARVEAEIQQRFDASADNLGTIAARAAGERDLIRAAPRDAAAAAKLFDALDAALAEDQGHTGITVYDAAGAPLAWSGVVADLARPLDGPAAVLVTAGALGPRLTRIEPIADPDRPASRLATIVAEQTLEPIDRSPSLSDRFVVSTSLAPVTLSVGAVRPSPTPAVFSITSRTGGTLIDAEVAPNDLAEARARWRRRSAAAVVSVFALTLLVCAGLLVEMRRRTSVPRTHLVASAGIVVSLVLSRALFRFATTEVEASQRLAGPADLLLTALVAAALVWLVIDLIEGRRLTRRRAQLLAADARGLVAVIYLAVGVLDAALLWSYGRFLQSVVSRTTVDLLHFSFHPFDVTRLGLAFGLVLLHAAAIWSMTALIRAPTLLCRMPRGGLPAVAAASWAIGALAGVAVAATRDPSIPSLPFVIALAAAGACAVTLPKLRVRARRVSQSMRIAGWFLALLVPAIAMYPSLSAFAIQAKERLIANEYGAQVIAQREDLKSRLSRALDQIDALGTLPQLVTAKADDEMASRAFVVWYQTDLQKYRVTSAVELYGPDGRRESRFALILPEVGTPSYRPTGCDWDLSDDVSPPRSSRTGANESHVLRASRGVCVGGRRVGGIIVRAMLDYRTLPFISSRSPYLESLRPISDAPGEGVSGRDVEFVLYGWSRAPLFASGTSVWTIPDAAFARMVDSRTPFWTDVDRGNERFRVHFMDDRGGIYALGYPVITAFGHLINLAELVTLALALFALLIAGAAIFNTVFSRAPASGRAWLREIRSSFYRKLRLAFWAGSVIPVVILALGTHAYFANELTAGIEDAAARTATVAQRLVEDYATLQQRGPGGLETLDDDIMMLVSRAIDEDVNLFYRTRLQATSALDLYASQVLSRRTPADVYRRLVLERAPTYVGEQDVGTVRYLVAAAPVRTAGRELVVTVPVTLRPLEIEGELDELDRRILFGAVLFSLLGGALGYWMAERIADPVNRLTRATRRIARGDLDARIAATSADELGRLVRDFNQMAADLQRQRSELERTQRLEAWADMARQVAHDIKNPLTPIQLSAEHAQRVNIDRGRPLSPVLDECVTVILSQVRLLRQISAEFSSFASSPTPHPEPTALTALIEEVVAPYRMGLADRISIEVTAPDALPPLTIDRTLFARALTNIIENALYAMPGKGAITITVRLKADTTYVPADVSPSYVVSGFSRTNEDGRTVEVEITDTGVGMDAEALGKMFEPYFSTKATGTGLGLTIAKRNIELNGGTIRVASERGVGTTVTLTLPV